ncbi:FecR family protein [Pseudofulvibacter geojedonensis]|uniref:FecR family protein n=1 Tax=Pseudofulvibacter geojedonensis TaxID=1123758 RepID=A0ABW3I0D5_9FLAO
MKNEKDILRWLNDEMSVSELDNFKKTNDFKDFEEIIETSKLLNYPVLDEEKALEDFKYRVSSSKKAKVIPLYKQTFFRVAASFLILLGLSIFYFSNSKTSYSTEYAQVKDFTLSDDTFINLNAGSEILFNEKKFANNRVLDLTGEAFFDVRKKGAFLVKTDFGNISVLGTSFNIKSRKQDFNVFCFTGKVKVNIKNKSFELTKGQGVRLDANGEIQAYNNTHLTTPSWMNNESVFHQVAFTEVLQEFERQYNVDIKYNANDSDFTYSGAFTNKNLSSAIKSITLPLNLKYEQKGNVITIYK